MQEKPVGDPDPSTAGSSARSRVRKVLIDADRAGGRTACLLPRVQVCVLDRADLVPGTADVLRRPRRPLPSHRVLVTGPSRTGDVEHILTVGAHGPVALHVLVV